MSSITTSIGKPKLTESIHQLSISRDNLLITLEQVLEHFKTNHLNGSLTIFFHSGGIGGGEYKESKKLK